MPRSSYPPLGAGAKEASGHSSATHVDTFGQPFDSIALPCCSSGGGTVAPSLPHSDAHTQCGPSRLGLQLPLCGEQQRSPQAQPQEQQQHWKQHASPSLQPQPLDEQRLDCAEAAVQPHPLQPSSPHGGGRSSSLGPSLGTSGGRVCKPQGQARERLPQGERRYHAAQLTLQILEQEVGWLRVGVEDCEVPVHLASQGPGCILPAFLDTPRLGC